MTQCTPPMSVIKWTEMSVSVNQCVDKPVWVVGQSAVLLEQMATPPQEVSAGLKGFSGAVPENKS